MTNTEIYNKAISKWGSTNQIDMCIEECAELIQAINKIKRSGWMQKPCAVTDLKYSQTYYNLCSEIADVKIMVEQMELMFDKEAIQISYERKLQRLEERVNK